MLTNIKTWLETTGYPTEENMYKKPPALPYIIFIESKNMSGADDKNLIIDRQINVELYSEKIDSTAETLIENLLTAIQYKKNRTWIDSESFFQTVYDFTLTEKI